MFIVILGSRYSVVRPAACLEPQKEYKIRIHFNRYKTNVATPDATTLIDSVSTLIIYGDPIFIDFFSSQKQNHYSVDVVTF